MTGHQAACLVCVLGILVLGPAAGLRVEIHTQTELVAAFNNEGVDHIVFMPGKWNFTEGELPYHAATVRGRKVILEGTQLPDGKQIYIDGNQLTQRVLITDGAELLQRNFWVDDCILSVMPFTCFTETMGGGARITLQDIKISDAACTRIADSTGVSTMLYAARYANPLTVKVRHLDERHLAVEDTGWVVYTPPTALWRMINVTFSCTGNITHFLPGDGGAGARRVRFQVATSAAVAVVVIAATVVYWTKTRASVAAAMGPAYRIAQAKGFELVEVLGSGRFGKVYRARQMMTRRSVAVKVLQLQPTNLRQLRSAWQECQLLGAVHHPCCVSVVTYYSAKLTQAPYDTTVSAESHGYLEHHQEVTNLLNKFASSPAGRTDAVAASLGIQLAPSSNAVDEQQGQGRRQREGQPGSSRDGSDLGLGSADDIMVGLAGSVDSTVGGGSGSGSSGRLSGSGGSSASEPIRGGALLLQVHVVMEFADQKTLGEAVQHGRFKLPSGEPNLPWIVDTAIDITRGLAFLHGPTHRLVHRDLSPGNVLLASHPNARGFRAMLSDFGLSTVLSMDATHKTSEMKGTIAYMPPELFGHDTVSTALDIYSLGILLCFVLTSVDPFHSMTPSALIRRKLAGGNLQVTLPRWVVRSEDPGVTRLVELIRWCTRFQRTERPSADEVLSALEALH